MGVTPGAAVCRFTHGHQKVMLELRQEVRKVWAFPSPLLTDKHLHPWVPAPATPSGPLGGAPTCRRFYVRVGPFARPLSWRLELQGHAVSLLHPKFERDPKMSRAFTHLPTEVSFRGKIQWVYFQRCVHFNSVFYELKKNPPICTNTATAQGRCLPPARGHGPLPQTRRGMAPHHS